MSVADVLSGQVRELSDYLVAEEAAGLCDTEPLKDVRATVYRLLQEMDAVRRYLDGDRITVPPPRTVQEILDARRGTSSHDSA
jgi:hypothetical protein